MTPQEKRDWLADRAAGGTLLGIVLLTIILAKFDSPMCLVHHVHMQSEQTPVLYGALAYDPGSPYVHAEQTLFPNTNRFISGGCVVFPNSPKFGFKYYCQACRDAQDAYDRKEKRRHELKLQPGAP